MKSRFARTLLLLGALLSAGVLLSVVGTRARTRPSSAQPSVAVSAHTAPRPDHQPARGLVRRAANPLSNPFDFRAASATTLWSAALAPAVVTTIVNYDFNSGASYSGLTPALASEVLSGASSTEPFVTFSPGTATTPAAFTANATPGVALGMNNSSGANTRYFQFTLGGSSLAIYNSYKVYVQAQRSTTGAQTLTLAYSTDGTNFTNFPTTLTVPDGSFAAQVFDLSLISQLNHKGFVVFRLLASGASGSGTLRIDNFQVQANSVPLAGSPSVAGNKTATLATDVNGNGFVNPGDTLMYSVVVSNGGTNAMNVVFTDQLNGNLTLVGTANASPIGVNNTYASIGNVGINVPDGASDLLADDVDPNGNALTITGVVGCADASAPFVCTTANGGNITVQADGSFTYNPAPGFEGGDFFAYTVSDGQSPAKTDTANVTITVSGMIWFVNAAAVSGGDGRLTTPFNCFFGTNCFDDTTLDEAGDNIFLYPGSYTGGQTLLNNQRLIGQGANSALVGAGSITGITIPPFSNTLPSTGGTNPTITTSGGTIHAITVGMGNTIRGITFGNTSGADIFGSGFGTLTIGPASGASDVTLNGNGQALNLTNGTLAARIVSITSIDSAAAGILLDATGGSLVSGSTTITNPTGIGINITDSNTGAAPTSSINVDFANTNVTGSGGTGVNLTNNTGSITFADLDIAPDAGQIALNATGNTGVITTTSGTISGGLGAVAVNIVGTSAASRTPLNIQLDSLSANGNNTAANGLVLTNTSATGSPGGFRVNGTGTTDGSGGTIQNTTARGANINTVDSLVLKNMNFTNANTVDGGTCIDLDISGCNGAIYLNTVTTLATFDNLNITGTTAENGITAINVANFKLDNSVLSNCGNDTNESCVDAQNLSGTSTVNNTTMNNAGSNTFDVVNNDVSWNLTINGSTFRDTQTSGPSCAPPGNTTNCTGEGGFQFRTFSRTPLTGGPQSGGNVPTTNIDIINSSFLRLRTQGIQVFSSDDSILNLDVTGSTIDAQNDIGTGLDLNASNTSTYNFNVIGNPTIQSRGGAAVNITAFENGHIEGRINNNPDIEVLGGPGIPVRILPQESSTAIIEVNGNTISNVNGTEDTAIDVQARFQDARADVTITNNTVTGEVTGIAGINLTGGSSDPNSNETNIVCADVMNNNVTNAAGNTLRGLRVRVSDLNAASDPRVFLEGFVEAGTPTQDVEATWNGRGNLPTSSGGSEVAVSLTGTATAPSAPPGGTCQFPDSPTPFAPSGGGTGERLESNETARLWEQLWESEPRWRRHFESAGDAPAGGSAAVASALPTRPVFSAFAAPLSYLNPLRLFTRSAAAAELADREGTESGGGLIAPATAQVHEQLATAQRSTPSAPRPARTMLVNSRGETRIVPTAALAGELITINGTGSGFTLPAGKSTTIMFNAQISGSFTGTAITNQASVSGTGFGPILSNNLSTPVIQAPGIVKGFSPTSIALSGTNLTTSTLTLTLTNPNVSQQLTNVAFGDTFPAGLAVADTPMAMTTGCGAPTFAPAANATSLSFSGGTINVGTPCVVSVKVKGTSLGAKNNFANGATSAQANTGANSNTATLNVLAAPSFTKSFGAPSIAVGGTTTLTFNITNNDATFGLTGIGFTDTLPAGLTVATSGPTATCGGTLSTTAPSTISFSGGTLIASGTCNFNVTVTGTTAGTKPNSASLATTETGTNATPATASLNVFGPPTISKSFTPSTIVVGQTSTLNIVVGNPSSNPGNLTGVSFTDTLPAGINAPNTSTSLCGGTVAVSINVVTLTGGSIAPNTACTIPITVTGIAASASAYTNTISSVSSANGGTNSTPATANITVNKANTTLGSVTDAPDPSVTGQPYTVGFVLSVTAPGSATPTAPSGTVTITDGTGGMCTATLPTTSCSLTSTTAGAKTLTLTYSGDSNFNGSNTTAGHQVDKANTTTAITSDNPDPSTPGGSVTVNFTVTPVAPGAGTPTGNVTISDSASAATCTADVATGTCNITLTTPGARTLTATYVGDANFNGSTSAGEPHTVASPPTISKAFGAAIIPLNGSTSLTFTVNNPNAGLALNGVSFTDMLPAGLVVATPSGVTSTCNGTVTAADGSGSISLAGGTLTGGGSCTITLNVTGTTAGAKDNTTSAISSTETGAGATSNTATLTVVAPPTLSKVFTPASIPLGATTSLDFTITNPNTTVGLSGISFTDVLPLGLTVADSSTTPCGGTLTVTAATRTIAFSGGTLTPGAPGNTCTFSVTVTGAAAGTQVNTTEAISSTEGGTGSTASATLNVFGPATVVKSFAPTSVALGGVATLTITITNPAANPGGLSGLSFTDSFPAGLEVDATPTPSNTCGGAFAPAAMATSISLSGGAIPAAGNSCTVSVNVKATTTGPKVNNVTVNSTEGGASAQASATLIVGQPPGFSKAFAPTQVKVGDIATLTFNISNPSGTQSLSGIQFNDPLPTGVEVDAMPMAINNACGGTFTPTAGATSVSFSGGTLAASGTCSLSVKVKATTFGVKENVTGAISATESGAGGTAMATLTVVGAPDFSKSFAPSAIRVGNTSSLSFTITNPNTTVGLTGIAFNDVLPAGLSISDGGPTAACGGTYTTTMATRTIAFTGGTLTSSASGNTCTFSVTVTGTAAGAQANTTGNITTNESAQGGTATATLNVFAPAAVVKSFSPTGVQVGGVSTLTISITNPAGNPGALNGLSFTDSFPAGLEVDAAPMATNTCGGTFAPLAAATSVSLAGGAIATAGNSCQLSVNVKGTTAGQKVNNIIVNSTEAGLSLQASATLNVAAAPTLAKSFTPSQIAVGQTSTLQFTINNPNAFALSGLQFTDTLPAGVTVATSGPIATCGGSLSTTAPGTLSFMGGTLNGGGSCNFSVTVTGAQAGAWTNTTGQISSTESGAGSTATATLTVVAPPNLTKNFAPNTIVFGQTSTLSFTITNPNTTAALSGISFNDVLPAGLSIANSPATAACGGSYTVTAATRTIAFSGGTLTPGAPGNTCTFSVMVIGQAVGAQVNTTSAVNSTEGGQAASGASATLTVNKADTATVITSDLPDPSTCGQVVTVSYTVTPVAPGAGTPTGNVTVSDGVNSCMGTVAAGQCLLTLTTFGNRTLTASYSGDGNFNGSTSAGVPHQVSDTTAPVITCPANQVGVTNISAPNAAVPVNYPAPTVTDACTGATVNCVPPSGSNFPLGTTPVNCTATDAGSNTAMCSFTVRVREPRAAIKDLVARVQTYVPPLTQAQANGLKGQLELANTRVEQGQLAQACTHMQNFVNQVATLTPSPLSAAQAQVLTSYANKIRNALGCTGGPFPAFRAETVGLYLAELGAFKLKNRLLSGPAELSEPGGEPNDQPVAGDWDGDGIDTLGVYRQGVFYLRHSGGLAAAPSEEAGRLDKRAETVVAFGQAGDVPVVGDWNGDGTDTIGVFRNGQFLLRNSNTAGEPELVINLGQAGDIPLAGDWDGDGTVTVGVYQVASGVFQLRNGWADDAGEVLVLWGGVDYLPIVGDWDGDGVTTVGLYSRTGEFLLRNTNTAGPAEIVLTLGWAGGLPLAGDWDGLP